MGMAEVVPGVSGGTIAFITGIYERLIEAIKSVNAKNIKALLKGNFAEFWKGIDGAFICTLVCGMFCGIVIGVFGIGYLLENFPTPLWAFFWGLILASSIYIAKQIEGWDMLTFLFVVIGIAIAVGIALLTPSQGVENYLWVFLCGMVAISAMILPGISGSFILLMLGMYTIVRSNAEIAMTTFDLHSMLVIGVFALGCLIGLMTFARLISYTFKHYKKQTLAILTGIMIGSLWKIWPWRNPSTYVIKDTGEQVPYTEQLVVTNELKLLVEHNVWPSQYYLESMTGIAIAAGIIGFALLFVVERLAVNK